MARSWMGAALAAAIVASGVSILPSAALAQRGGVSATANPGAGTAQRRAIMDALRPAVARRLGGNVEFVVDRIRVANGWALVIAQPQRPGGGRIDPSRFFSRQDLEFMDGVTVSAILRFRGGRWTLVDHAIGATDVWYCDPRVGAPRALTGC